MPRNLQLGLCDMTERQPVYYPTLPQRVPLLELGWSNVIYLADGRGHRDPTMVWGTSVELDHMDEFLAVQSRESNRMVSIVHVLIKAVSRSLREHPQLNRRVIGRRVHPYEGTSIVVPIRRPADGVVDVVFFRDGESLTLADVASRMWDEARERALSVARERRTEKEGTPLQKWWRTMLVRCQMEIYKQLAGFCFGLSNRLRMPSWSPWGKEMNGANAFVNFLGFAGAPPMISYKPSSLPTNSFGVSVTMGIPEQKPVVHGGQIVVRKVAPLFIRVDHRLVNGHQTGEFVATLRNHLMNPWSLVESNPRSAGDHLARAA
jgi:2-oxoacid dehydrogenases acyltransferase (catalytic domain)